MDPGPSLLILRLRKSLSRGSGPQRVEGHKGLVLPAHEVRFSQAVRPLVASVQALELLLGRRSARTGRICRSSYSPTRYCFRKIDWFSDWENHSFQSVSWS